MLPFSESERSALDAILARSRTDVAFRLRLLSEPREAIRDVFDVRLPADFRIRFVERDPDVDALVVLPEAAPPMTADPNELADDELEQVTGGAHAQNAHLAWKGAVAPPPPGHAR